MTDTNEVFPTAELAGLADMVAAFEMNEAAILDAEKRLAEAVREIESTGGKFFTASGLAPFQAEGVYRDHAFYFRARHGEWSLQIGDEYDTVEWVATHGDTIGYGSDVQVWPNGDMDPATGLRFAMALIDEWVTDRMEDAG